MTTSSNLCGQLAGMMNAIKYYSHGSPPNQNYDLSFMTLIWPLLPLMPPEPPKSILELFREPERCDVCGVKEKRPLLKCTKSVTGGLKPCLTEDSLRPRFPIRTKMPLDKLMHEIEMKMDETLSRIETTSNLTDQLKYHAKELNAEKSDLTEDEFMRRLNQLAQEKEAREKRVKELEGKEKELKKSLMTAIKWAKDIEASAKEQNTEKTNNLENK